MKIHPIATINSFLLLTILLGCGGPDYEHGEDDSPEEIPKTEAVAPDGILEAVTWNIERYNADENSRQTKNAVEVMDSLDADLFALQEIYSQETLDALLKPLTGYKGFVADHVDKGQKMGLVYNTNTIKIRDSGFISETDVRPDFRDQWNYYWANGRMPLFIEFSYSYQDITELFYVVVVHGKANTGDNAAEYTESYERRQNAAEGLYHYLMDEKSNANIILLGDYNDDVDQSVFYYDEPDNFAETPYDEFVEDSINFNVITKTLSDIDQSASINYEDLIDHITISDELFRSYIDGSAAVYANPQDYIPEYENTTSDHLPVWAKFDVSR